eukprot:1956356-Rhodomonas_salina.1
MGDTVRPQIVFHLRHAMSGTNTGCAANRYPSALHSKPSSLCGGHDAGNGCTSSIFGGNSFCLEELTVEMAAGVDPSVKNQQSQVSCAICARAR